MRKHCGAAAMLNEMPTQLGQISRALDGRFQYSPAVFGVARMRAAIQSVGGEIFLDLTCAAWTGCNIGCEDRMRARVIPDAVRQLHGVSFGMTVA